MSIQDQEVCVIDPVKGSSCSKCIFNELDFRTPDLCISSNRTNRKNITQMETGGRGVPSSHCSRLENSTLLFNYQPPHEEKNKTTGNKERLVRTNFRKNCYLEDPSVFKLTAFLL